MIITALIMIMNWISVLDNQIPNLNLVLGLTIGPLIYLFTKSLVHKNFKITFSDKLNFLPFIILLPTIFTDFIAVWIYAALIFISITLYDILSFKELANYERLSNQADSNTDRLKLGWFKKMLSLILLILFVNITSFMIQNYYGKLTFPIDVILLFALLLLFINSIVFQALKHPDIFIDIDDDKIKSLAALDNTTHTGNKELAELFEKIESIMKKDKPYLNPDFLITDLAKLLKEPYKLVSQAINRNSNLNFSEYVNRFRIEEIKQKMKSPEYSSKPLLELMYENGFNTKSNFNRAFKKFTSFTPSQYKKEISNRT